MQSSKFTCIAPAGRLTDFPRRSDLVRFKNAYLPRTTIRRHLRAARCLVVSQASSDRAVVVLPGLGNNAADYNKLAEILKNDHSLHVEIAPVSRLDWARNGAGLLDTAYWKGTLKPRPTVDWYLNRIDAAIQAAKQAAPDVPVTLLAHSAGGWLGRLYMLEYGTASLGIDRFVSLGSPHQAPPPGVVDQTRGILTWISKNTPESFHDDVDYVTIAGKYIQGAPLTGPGGWQRRVVGAGYQQVCGSADVWGDGVVPVPAAHLQGALQLTLEGVYHSPLGAQDGSIAQGGENNEVSAALAEGNTDPIGSTDGVTRPGDYSSSKRSYDSDEYEVTLEQVERAAAEVESPGPRLWYGSMGILHQWVGLLRDSTNAPIGSVLSSSSNK